MLLADSPQRIEMLRIARGLAQLIGEAPAFKHAIREIPVIAKAAEPVLILGETGTGKELVARALHDLSERALFPLVVFNCGSFTETLLEDELFGHERGAFTDANARRKGLMAQAHKGTVFLDEVDTLPARAQVDLLRVIQEKTFRSLGSQTEQHVDVRILAATNAPLDDLVRSGRFRADLYYRLGVFSVGLPPLRDHKGDVAVLARHFLKKHAIVDRLDLQLSIGACAALMAYDWPGNVRELENVIIRAVRLGTSAMIEVADLRLYPRQIESMYHCAEAEQSRSLRAVKKDLVENFERQYLLRLLSQHDGNVSHAARACGKERRALGKLLKKHGLR
jgi:transcriptional regulator with GAF, ATPase, and Fis domain